MHTEMVYCIPGWMLAAWGSITVLLAIVAYYLGAWRGWRTRPVNFYQLAHCEMSEKTNYSHAPGCPFAKQLSTAERAAEHAKRNEECAAMLEVDLEKREGGE